MIELSRGRRAAARLGVAILVGVGLASGSASAAATISATEGALFSGPVATAPITCTPVASPAATIDWGDNTVGTTATVTASGSQLEISGAHTYAEAGAYAGSVSGYYLCNRDQVGFSATFTAQVADASLRLSPAAPPALTAGTGFSGMVATLVDANPDASLADYTVGLTWGDGTSSAAAVSAGAGEFGVTGTHTYANPGSYDVQVAIRDRGGAEVTASETVTVNARAGLKLKLGPRPRTGDGTAAVSIYLPCRGTVTVTQAGHGRLVFRGLRHRVERAGSLTLILRPTPWAHRLERREHRLRVTGRVRFTPLLGKTISIPVHIVFDYVTCSAGLTFHYTGAEQSCVVGHASQLRILAAGGAGGGGPPGCFGFPSESGGGGRGAQADATRVPVKPVETLYIEVGGNGGSGRYDCGIEHGTSGAGGWNGGGSGALPVSQRGSGGGGGATDVRTVSCASLCDQGAGFGALISLASRIVVAGGGGGGGTGGGAGGCQSCTTTGGAGGWSGFPGGTDPDGSAGDAATISGTQGILGVGGGGGTGNGGGAGGTADPSCGSPNDPPPCTNGASGHVGVGGIGGGDPFFDFSAQPQVQGYAGGGGGGGLWGGGGADGGVVSLGDTVGGGGGGGGGSSFGPSRTYFSAAYQPAEVEIVSVG